jgi:hypothetical protein
MASDVKVMKFRNRSDYKEKRQKFDYGKAFCTHPGSIFSSSTASCDQTLSDHCSPSASVTYFGTGLL